MIQYLGLYFFLNVLSYIFYYWRTDDDDPKVALILFVVGGPLMVVGLTLVAVQHVVDKVKGTK